MRDIIDKIVTRAQRQGLVRGPQTKNHWYKKITATIDLIVATRKEGLDPQRLLDADDFNFTHDIVGIAAHMDREKGCFTGHFLPRHRVKS